MNKLLDLLPTIAVSAFITMGYLPFIEGEILGPLGTLAAAPLALVLWGQSRRGLLTPLAVTLCAFVVLAGLAIWVWPTGAGRVVAFAPEAVLYAMLFLTAVVPLLTGRRPFTEYYARRTEPEAVWQTDIFKNINRDMTWVWAGLFAASACSALSARYLSSDSPQTINIIFRLVIPAVLMLGVGVPFNTWYPKHYQKKLGLTQAGWAADSTNPDQTAPTGQQPEETMSEVQDINSAKEMIQGMPSAFNAAAAGDLKATVQYEVSGDEEFTAHLVIADGACTYNDGPADSPDLVVQTPADVWLGISKGEINGQAAFMSGKFKAQGNMGILLQMGNLFKAG